MTIEQEIEIAQNELWDKFERCYNFWRYNEDAERIAELCYRIADTDANWKDSGWPFDEAIIKECSLKVIKGCILLLMQKGTQDDGKMFGPEIVVDGQIMLQILGCYMNMLDFGLGYMPWAEWNARYRAYLEEIDYRQQQVAACLADKTVNPWDELLPEEW